MPYSPEQAMQMKLCATNTCTCAPNQDYQGGGKFIGTVSHDLNLIRAGSDRELTDHEAERILTLSLEWLALYPSILDISSTQAEVVSNLPAEYSQDTAGNFYLHPSSQKNRSGIVDSMLEQRKGAKRRMLATPSLRKEIDAANERVLEMTRKRHADNPQLAKEEREQWEKIMGAGAPMPSDPGYVQTEVV